MNTIAKCFNVIVSGDRDASRKAARQVRKLVYASGDRGKYEDVVSIIDNASKEYVEISEDWRRGNFVMAVSVLYFLHDRESQPDFLFPWLYHLIQDPNGNIRHSAVRMFEYELGPLTYHIRFPNEKQSYFYMLSPKQADRILLELFANLMSLMNDVWKPAYKKYKYIASLPTGPFKSIQMVLGRIEEDCGEEYTARLEQRLKLPQ